MQRQSDDAEAGEPRRKNNEGRHLADMEPAESARDKVAAARGLHVKIRQGAFKEV
ncbi:MAG: hypothetical protein U5J99_00805 [Parvularculaceae bacterium]|nr:hypothetical protein [Parvularculaceae bacterium]